MSGYTPGNWHVDPKRGLRIVADGDITVGTVGCDASTQDCWEANARLFAASKDLLEALKAMLPENCGPADDPAGHRRPSFAKCEVARIVVQRATNGGDA